MRTETEFLKSLMLCACCICLCIQRSLCCHYAYSEIDQFNLIFNAIISQCKREDKLSSSMSSVEAEGHNRLSTQDMCTSKKTKSQHGQCSGHGGGVSEHENMALVLYNPTHLSKFREETKTFTFAGRTITIHQKWEKYGVAAVVWDAAVVLAEYLEKSIKGNQLVLRGKSFIELGAGTGLVGIVASLLGGNVVSTDRPVALDQLQANIDFNVPQTSGRSGGIIVKELNWGEKLHTFPETYDLVVGADIVYLEDTFPKLVETIVHLSTKTTLVLLSCRIRYARDEQFLDMMKEQFVVAEILHDKSRNIHVFEARLI